MIKIREIQTISEEEVPWLAPSYIHSDCRCLGAFEDACAGIILYEIKERILYIRYVYVREELRGQGIGGMLFQELQELAQREAPEGMIVSGVVSREHAIWVHGSGKRRINCDGFNRSMERFLSGRNTGSGERKLGSYLQYARASARIGI